MKITAHVTRFRDKVAVCFIGADGATIYHSASEARALADAINLAAEDIDAREFSESSFKPVEIPLTWRHQ